ncbi:MarR family winged helix-turn-helix transcriptional regulator [Devosia sp. ZB163]|uniref:MarR family winged helix-turn-helix transcriptional regulator n=1 Tax=Devosia sp. ZB163 TaxID=3025938 RepID=UPI002360EF28|nr:MarR family winged helix-turn-helix transcriptional regulator [Devosia sp. ZB163]MDC9824243.1 MarR family winged helix-turn-helix transcriptional regulator [Devosia sp. ZB163]
MSYDSAGAWVKRFHLAARSAMEAALRPYDLGSTQWYVLWHLVHEGPMAQRHLLDLLQVEKPTLSGVVSALVRKGLVEQSTAPEDQRQKLLSITTTGRALWDTLPDPIALMRAIAFEGTPEEDLATVVRVLRTGTERLNNVLKVGKKS